jgi:hypothetical protein
MRAMVDPPIHLPCTEMRPTGVNQMFRDPWDWINQMVRPTGVEPVTPRSVDLPNIPETESGQE